VIGEGALLAAREVMQLHVPVKPLCATQESART